MPPREFVQTAGRGVVGSREQRSRKGFLKELPPALGFDRKKEGVALFTSCVQGLRYSPASPAII